MATPEEQMDPALMKAMLAEMQRQTQMALVLLDGMLHQSQGLGIPSNVMYVVMDSYVMQMRERMESMFGKDIVAELEKGAAEGAKLWWAAGPEAKPAAPKKDSDPMFA